MSHTIFILFGATGDLALRYLLPSLSSILAVRGTEALDILAVGRRPYSTDEFRAFLERDGVDFFPHRDHMGTLLSHLSYTQVEIDREEHYDDLFTVIREKCRDDTQIVIYLSIATAFFIPFLHHILRLLPELPPVRVVFEKPFGSDLISARHLESEIEAVFTEESIYRIDHYVAKNGIENLLAFRFGNTLFSPVWNKEYIDNIQITASETLGVGDRGAFYESAGALRDMIQNHLFQTLAMVLMRRPEDLSPLSIRLSKTEALESFVLSHSLIEDVVFGQYDGYRAEKDVSPESRTETFVALKLGSTLPEWEGVPLYIRTGKSLDAKITQIVIEFREAPEIGWKHIAKNRIIIEVQPDESITMQFSKKSTTEDHALESIVSETRSETIGKGAYEKLLEDVIDGDPTLFTTWKMLESTWKTIDPIIHCREVCPILHSYTPGSRGPSAQYDLLTRDGRAWYEK